LIPKKEPNSFGLESGARWRRRQTSTSHEHGEHEIHVDGKKFAQAGFS
jgi:hypothetical protein